MSLEVNIKENEVEYFCINSEDVDFNVVIGCIEDMLMNDEFLKMQNDFMDKYWNEFDDSEENKLIYTDIFKEYQDKIEQYIEDYLQKTIKGFSMNLLIQDILERRDDLDGEIFEMLFTFTDFVVFKEMFLDYKAMKEGKTVDLSNNISIKQLTAITNVPL